jgi:DNA-binding transcriptional MocR family regulator
LYAVKFFIVTMTIWEPSIERLGGPRYLAIADALAADIKSRRLHAGERLPTHRDLAYRLGVTVGTVTRAYSEAQRRGLVEGEVGRGTYVRADPSRRSTVPSQSSAEGAAGRPIALNTNFPTDLDAIGENGDLMKRTLGELAGFDRLVELFNYQPHGGLLAHRDAASAFMRTFGVEVPAERIIVTAGAQHALFVALSSIVEPGDVIGAEALTWPGLRRLADFLRVRVQGLAMDQDGIVPEAFEAACQARKLKALFCVSNFHNPTTLIVPLARRKAIAEIARRYGVHIIEDDVYGFLSEERLPPIVSFAPELGLILTSVSKSLAPGLRIGYLAILADEMTNFSEAIRMTIHMAAPLTSEIAARWIVDGTALRLMAARREEQRRRQALAAHILNGLPIRSQPTAMNLWLELPDHWPADAFALAARNRGVAVSPAGHFAQMRGTPNGVRVSLSAPRGIDEVERGLAILASLCKSGPNRENDVV